MRSCEDDVMNVVAEKLIAGIGEGFIEAGLKDIPRSFVGMGPIPSEDCCPDVVVWISNIRFYDSASPDTLIENRLLNHYGTAFDVNVRVGNCFFEMDGDGNLIDIGTVSEWAKTINRYTLVAYWKGAEALHTDPELVECLASVTPQAAFPFQDGGCAGYTWAITVAVI